MPQESMPRQAYADTGEYTEYNVSQKEISESIAKRRNLIFSYEIYTANTEGKTGTGFPGKLFPRFGRKSETACPGLTFEC